VGGRARRLNGESGFSATDTVLARRYNRRSRYIVLFMSEMLGKKLPMFYGFRYRSGLWLLMPVLFTLFFFGHAFWIVIPLLCLAFCLLPRYGFFRSRQMPFSPGGMPPVQPSALEILRQRYARGEIDAVTYEQMRERLEASDGPSGQ
jgi:uncharacterized membrane protein